jgi:photosystem II stability/assembly factor-like uncharacterized protein
LPTHATILAFAVDPRDLQRVYAGAYDTTGAYLSTDGARTWHALDAGLDRAPVLALRFAGDTLMAGTTAGLYRLRADRWENVGGVPAVAVYALVRDAAGATYLSTDGRGVWTSADDGKTWTRIPGLEGEIVLSVAALDARTVLAGTSGHGAFLTRDGGATWRALDGFGGEYVSLIAVDPRDARTVYLRTRGGLYRSRDAGKSWQRLLGGIETEIVHALLFDSTSPRLYAATGGRGVFVSADGEVWGMASGALPPGVATLALAQADAHTLLAGTQTGVYLTHDGGGTWQAANEGLGVPQLHALALDPQSGALFAATEDGLYRASPPGDFVRVGEAALSLPVLSLALAPDRIYAGTYRRGIFVSRDGGASWDPVGDIFRGRLSAAGLALDPRNADSVFARVLFGRIFKSTDRGDTWHSVWPGMPDDAEVETMSIAPGDPRQMFAGTNDGIYYSGDGGETWARRGLASRTVFAIWIDPHAPNHLLAGATDGVYRSDDAGDHWLASGLAAISVTALAQNGRGDFYAGTKYTGVWVSRDDGRTWARLGAGLDEASVIALAADDAHGMLYAATTRGLVQYGGSQ